MKRILTIILILFSFHAYSQHDTVDIVLSGSSTDTASLSNRINLKKNIADSVSGVATDYVTQYQRKKTSDSLQALIQINTDSIAAHNIRIGANTTSIAAMVTLYETQTASGSTTFTFTTVPASYNDYIIFVNGAKIRSTTDYTTSGNIVTISTIISGDIVEYNRIK